MMHHIGYKEFFLKDDYKEGKQCARLRLLFQRFTSIFLQLIIVIGITFSSSSVHSAASLAAEDIIDEIPVTINGVLESFTVIRDALIEEQWYMMPDRPRIFERTINDVKEPDFALIRYQFKDPKNPQKLLEGGLLQFATSLALPPEAIAQLETAIKEKIGTDKPIRLASMPFNEAKVSIYTPGSGDLIADAPQGAGIAPVHATQKMVFSIPMTRVGSDVYNELINGNTGVPVIVEYSYNGLTPPAGFKVEVDWDQTYKHYSKDQKFAAKASYLGLVGGSTNLDKQEIRDSLIDSSCLKVLVTEGEKFKKADMDVYLEPILARINAQLLERLSPPQTIAPAKSRGTSAKGKYFSAAYSMAIKDISQVKKGKEVIDFNVRQHVVRKSIVSGFIGIGRYSDELKEKLVTIVPEGPWKSAYFVLPAVGDAKDLGINQVDLEIGLSDGNQIRQSQVVVWTPEGGWKDREGTPRTVLSFALMGLKASGFKVDDAQFSTKTQITLKREVMKIDQMLPVFDGESAVTTPLAAVDVVSVDGSLLSWNKIDESSRLAVVNVKLESGDRKFSAGLKPRNINGDWTEPQPLLWLLEKNGGPVRASIKYLYNDGSKKDWSDNGRDLLNDLDSLDITLFDQ